MEFKTDENMPVEAVGLLRSAGYDTQSIFGCHKIRFGYIPEVLAMMRNGGRANTLSGMLRGQQEIRQAFKINGLPYPLQIAVRRPMIRIQQIALGHRRQHDRVSPVR